MNSSATTVSHEILKLLKGGLIVSCQASDGEPLCAPEHINALALSALIGGSKGLRLEGADNIAFVRQHTRVPIVGLSKSKDMAEADRLMRVYITPTFNDAALLANAGADIIAMDATARPRPDGSTLKILIARVKDELKKLVWADVSTLAEGMAAADAGADVISTTLAGYTAETFDPKQSGPDFDLLKKLCKELALPVVLEGKVWSPEEVTQAFALGAYSVVVGSAITRPQLITARFVKAIAKARIR